MTNPRPVGTALASTWDTDLPVVASCTSGKQVLAATSSKKNKKQRTTRRAPELFLIVRVGKRKGYPQALFAAAGPASPDIRSQAVCVEAADARRVRVFYVLGTYGGHASVTMELFKAGASVAHGADTVTASPNGRYAMDLYPSQPVVVGDLVTVRITASEIP